MTDTPLLHFAETDSTNALLKRMRPPHDMAVYADAQTAGRGQRGNSWHAMRGENLLMSVCRHPLDLHPLCQFSISEATATGVCLLLESYGIDAKIKWPNDIYVGHDKICGILIEHAVGAKVESSIIGIGLNLNQTCFPPLPNPVSASLLTGERYDIAGAARSLLRILHPLLQLADTKEGRAQLHDGFMSRLYRGDGLYHKYRDTASGDIFLAVITDIRATGHLELRDESGSSRLYAFKEVEFILPDSDTAS